MDTPVNSAPIEAPFRIKSPMTLGSALTDLFQAAKFRMNSGDLKELSGLSEAAQRLARQMGASCEQIGVMVADERDVTGDAARTGAFQSPHDLPELLFWIANTAELIDHAIGVANEAAYEAGVRQEGEA